MINALPMPASTRTWLEGSVKGLSGEHRYFSDVREALQPGWLRIMGTRPPGYAYRDWIDGLYEARLLREEPGCYRIVAPE